MGQFGGGGAGEAGVRMAGGGMIMEIFLAIDNPTSKNITNPLRVLSTMIWPSCRFPPECYLL